VAYANRNGLDDREGQRNRASKQTIHPNQFDERNGVWGEFAGCVSVDDWKRVAAQFLRADDGLASRMDRLKAIGNGQVPLCAATAWRYLSELL